MISRVFLPIFVLLLCTARITADWSWIDPQPQGNSLTAITGDGKILIAVGESGTILLKKGDQWHVVPSPIREDITSAQWDTGRFIISGPEAGVWASPDGENWERLTGSAQSAKFLLPVSKGRILAVGDSQTWLLNPDGETTLGTSLSKPFSGVSNGQQALLVFEDGRMAISSNGSIWRYSSTMPGVRVYRAAGGSQGFLVAGYAEDLSPGLWTSSDGLTWSPLASPPGASYAYQILAASDSWLFQDANTGKIWRYATSEWLEVKSDEIFPSSTFVQESSTFLVGYRGLLASMTNDGDLAIETLSQIQSLILVPSRFSAVSANGTMMALDTNVTPARLYRLGADGHWVMENPASLPNANVLGKIDGEAYAFSNGSKDLLSGLYRFSDGNWSLSISNENSSRETIIPGQVISFAGNDAVVLALSREEWYGGDDYSAKRGLFYSEYNNIWKPFDFNDLKYHQPISEGQKESVVWDGRRFVLLLHPGRIFISSDGLEWTRLPEIPSDPQMQTLAAGKPSSKDITAVSIASNGSTIVARAGKSAEIASEGTETVFVWNESCWWPVTLPVSTDDSLRLVTWDGSLFHIPTVKNNFTSPDGFQWYSEPLPSKVAEIVHGPDITLAFTPSFSILERLSIQLPVEEVPTPRFLPRTKFLSGESERFTLELTGLVGDWEIKGLPKWLSVNPVKGFGNATLQVEAQSNPGRIARGTVIRAGDARHLLSQNGTQSDPLPIVPAKGGRLTIPFSGDWIAGASSSLVGFPQKLPFGKGPVSISLPANTTPNQRSLSVTINGFEYKISQSAFSLSQLHSGTYHGVLGSVVPEGDSSSLGDFESIEGTLEVTISASSPAAPWGTYSARASIFWDNKLWTFRHKGRLSNNGTITGAWVSSNSEKRNLQVDLKVVRSSDSIQILTGNFSSDKLAWGAFAGKNIVDGPASALDPQNYGKATFFLTPFGSELSVSTVGVGAVSISSKGVVKITSHLVDGTSWTSSSKVWAAAGDRFAFPFSRILSRNQGLLAGVMVRTEEAESADWLGSFVQQSKVDHLPSYFTASLTRYTPPSQHSLPLEWASVADVLLTTDAGVFSGNATAGDKLLSSLADRRFNLQLQPATGLWKGTLVQPNSKAAAISITGAVNTKYRSFSGSSKGAIYGFPLRQAQGNLSIQPQ